MAVVMTREANEGLKGINKNKVFNQENQRKAYVSLVTDERSVPFPADPGVLATWGERVSLQGTWKGASLRVNRRGYSVICEYDGTSTEHT